MKINCLLKSVDDLITPARFSWNNQILLEIYRREAVSKEV